MSRPLLVLAWQSFLGHIILATKQTTNLSFSTLTHTFYIYYLRCGRTVYVGISWCLPSYKIVFFFCCKCFMDFVLEYFSMKSDLYCTIFFTRRH